MSSSWSPGDLVQGTTTVLSAYQSKPELSRSEDSEASRFIHELELFLKYLNLLSQLQRQYPEAFGPPGQATPTTATGLGNAYNGVLERCARFVDRHRRLLIDHQLNATFAGSSTSVRRGAGRRKVRVIPLIEEEETWRTQLEEVESLRRPLERYAMIATLKTSRMYSNRIHVPIQAPAETRLENLKTLQAVKILSDRVSFLLKRCILESSSANGEVSSGFVDQLRRRALNQLVESNLHPRTSIWAGHDGSNSRKLGIPIKYISTQNSHAIDRIHEISQIMAYLMIRQSPDTVPKAKHIAFGSWAAISWSSAPSNKSLDSVTQFFENIRDAIDIALDHIGYNSGSVARSMDVKGLYSGIERSMKALTAASEDWKNLRSWVATRLMHYEEPIGSPFVASSMPSSPSPTTRPGSTFSLPYLPSSHESHPSPTGRRRSSYVGHHGANRDSISTLSSVNLGTPWDIIRATAGIVKVTFPGPHGQPLHSMMQCSVDIVSHPNSGEVVSIVSLGEDNPGTVRHTIHPNRSSTIESCMIPHLDNMHVYRSREDLYRLHFQGMHKIEIEKNRQVMTYTTRPIYICRDREDYLSFQAALLKREVKYIADIVRIVSNGEQVLSKLDTIRVLQGSDDGMRSILYYAANRGHGCMAGFMEWPVNAFEPESKPLGTASLELRLNKAALEMRRRRGSTSANEPLDPEAMDFSGLDGEADNLNEIKKLEMHFYEIKDRDDFRNWLRL